MKTTLLVIHTALLLAIVPAHADSVAAQSLTFPMLAKATLKQPQAPSQPPASALHQSLEAARGPATEEVQHPFFPEELKKLDGKKVSISGFITPYADPDNMTKMLLTKSPVGCFFCNPPEENGVVFIRLAAKEKPVSMDNPTITVEGTFHLVQPDCKDEEAAQFFFTIDDAKVTHAGP